MRIIIGCFILLLSMSALAQPENCSTIDYLSPPNSPFRRMPVQDQDGTGICYAYVAAQLVDYHLISSGQASGPSAHPVWLALKSSSRILEAGLASSAINAMRTHGSCSYEQIENTLNTWAGQSGLTGSPLVGFIEHFYRQIYRSTGGNLQRTTAATRDRAWEFATNEIAGYCPDLTIEWNLLNPQITELTGTSVQIFNQLIGQTCSAQNISRPQIPEPREAVVTADADAEEGLNALVATGPYNIGYCAGAWDDPNFDGIERRDGNNTFPDAETCGMHASVVVGRRVINGSCQMLVRNTWGTGWGDWTNNRKCFCRHKTTGAMVPECEKATHDNGDYTVEACYIERSHLARNLDAVMTLTPPPEN